MTEVEWLDIDGRPLDAPAPSAPPDRAAGYRPDVRSPALWLDVGRLVTAALAVVAPFLQVYRLRIQHSGGQQVDGWGRFDAALNVAEGPGAHGIRFGIVTCIAAGLVLAAVVLQRVRRTGSDRPARLPLVCCALGVGLLAATTAAALLDTDALIDSVRSQLVRFENVDVQSSVHIGAGTWTMGAAAAVGLVTLVAEIAMHPAAPATVHPRGTVDPPLLPGDEAL